MAQLKEFNVDCVETKTDNKTQHQYSKFVLEPLERGQGLTVGNALRRVLLSNLEGTAVTAARIAGVTHEFATIPGVREDALEILLNLKELVFRSYSPGPQIARLAATGPKTVTAGDFNLPSEVEVIDSSKYVATIAEGAKLEMEIRIEKGRGYRVVDLEKEDASSLDFLQIDAVFMPVSKVKYTVEEMRADEGENKDRLFLEITTNGSIQPDEALSQAATVLVELFHPLGDLNIEPVAEEKEEEEDPNRQTPIEELQLSVRAYNCLKRAQINSVADLLEYSYEDLLEIKNFGQKSAEEVVEALQARFEITLPQEKSTAS
ncbi:MAG: DNA-directed RNA polymerase subunit alpha [Halothece sp.]